MAGRGAPRKFSPDQERLLAEEYAEGATFRELATKHGGTDVSVRSAVLRAGGKARPATTRSTWSSENAVEALRLYREGRSVRDLARHFHVRDRQITAVLQDAGEKLHPGGRDHPRFRTAEECSAVAAEYADGASVAALAKKYGCSITPVKRAVERGGGTLREPGRSRTWTDQTVAWAADQYRDGRSQQSIADELGVSQCAVSNQLIRSGAISRVPQTRENHGSWKGGRVVSDDGYAYVLATDEDLPFCRVLSNGYMAEHRLVMGRALGRKLTRRETVHHINGDRADNRLENLQLRQGQHGAGVVIRCNACGSHDVAAVEITTG